MSAPLIVGRGFALVYKSNGEDKVSAVASGPEAASLKRRVGGVIVNVKGQRFRYGQSRQVRVLLASPAELRALA